MTSPRRELIGIQKRLARELKERIYGRVTGQSAAERRYFNEYKKLFRRRFTVTDKAALVREILKSDIVYVGDYHTLRQAQKSLQRILRAVLRRKRDVALALEMVHSRHQSQIDRFLSGAITETQFLREIDYLNTWGFNWRHYRMLFRMAKEHGFPVIGLNCAPDNPKLNFAERMRLRDFHAAAALASARAAHPGRLFLTLYGDLHVAPSHLPELTRRQAELLGGQRGGSLRDLIIYQNSETVYWKLAQRHLENRVDVVRFNAREWCVMNTVPVAKWQSFLFWDENRANYSLQFKTEWYDYNELATRPDGDDEEDDDWEEQSPGVDMSEQVAQVARTLARFLKIRGVKTDALQVFTAEHLNVLDELGRRGNLSRAQLKAVARRITLRENFYLPAATSVYLSDLSLNHAAELAAEYLRHQCAGEDVPANRQSDFYARVLRSALGFFGSLVINHKRMCYRDADHRRVLQRGLEPGASADESARYELADLVLNHRALEAGCLRTGRRPARTHKLYDLPYPLHVATAQALGYSLGDLLYAGLVQGIFGKKRIRELFHASFSGPHDAWNLYAALLKQCRRVRQPYASKRERL